MWNRLPEASAPVEISIDGERFIAHEGDTAAAALLAAGVEVFRTSFSGAPRAPLCMMGACFECLVTIDGQRNRQACMVTVAPGMTIETTAP
jgi:predicted molibdopterin-dependent oxidoreductase YjgC